MDIVLRYKPHKTQLLLHESTANFKTALCGRRWGKSLAACYELIKRIIDPDIKMAWLAPSYSTCSIGVDAMKHICRDAPGFVKFTGNSPVVATFCNGVKVPFISLERPEFLRGKGLSYAVIDESELIKDATFYDIISPCFAQSQNAESLYISTPRRKNSWFHKAFLKGQDPIANPKFESFHFPSESNPYLSREYIEEQRLSLPHDTFIREYLAQYTDADSSVFKSIWPCVNDGDPTCDHCERSIGFDMAKTQDYCVLTAMCTKCGKIVDFDRFNQVDWVTVVDKMFQFQIKNTKGTEPTPIYFDATGVGAVVADMIKDKGILNTIPYIFSNPSKQKLITDLKALFDHQRISIPAHLTELLHELQVFEVVVSKSGNNIYNAPDSMHDDCVWSLGLCAQGLVKTPAVCEPWVYEPDELDNIGDNLLNFIYGSFD